MRILLVCPEYPDTFWNFKSALKFVFKKAFTPPLGLLTVANMLPQEWKKRLIDMNVTTITDKDLKWADMVLISAILVQKNSAMEVVRRCKKAGVKIVAGGPLFIYRHEEFNEIDHFVLNEAEITLPPFLKDLKNGQAKHIYTSDQKADVRKTPLPLWELINIKEYAVMPLQYSRGCPFNCEFCDVALRDGRISRTKDRKQIIQELECLYSQGWRDGIFFVDDNFIGNKAKLKKEILPAIAEWMENRRYPFTFTTQTAINLSDDEELMKLMVKAGFNIVFVGIETPNEESLKECDKLHNKNRDLISCVKKMQKFGLQVWGGFIVGFDNDPVSIFENQINFIQKSGIVTAQVNLLGALEGTRLYRRLQKENRLLNIPFSGDNTECSINFVPKMDYYTLINGYKRIISTIYSPACYYARVEKFLREYNNLQKRVPRFHAIYIGTFLKAIMNLGIVAKERVYFWKLIFWSLFRHPRLFPLTAVFIFWRIHFQKIVEKTHQNKLGDLAINCLVSKNEKP